MLASLIAYKNAIAGALVLALVLALGAQSWRLDRAGQALALADARALVLTAQADGLGVQLDAQNAGIEALRVAADKSRAAAAVAARKAQAALTQANARAAALEAAPVPATCADAIQFLVTEAAR